ncbi:MAG: SDR family oxidoreductase [Cyclobacteriaceae bacterium]
MNKINDKVTVITGGNSGIGLGTAKLFKENGAKVITNAKSPSRLQETEEAYRDIFEGIYQADLSDIHQVDGFFKNIKKDFGRIDILFLNAGIVQFSPIDMITEELYDSHFDLNVKGMMFSVKAALPMMEQGGTIIMNSSTNVHKAMPYSSIYSATKAAIKAFAQVLTAELAPRGIRVNTLTPGPIQTPIIDKMNMTEEQLAASAEYIRTKVPLGRFGQPAEVATLVAEIATNQFINGQEFIIDGGLTAL